MLHPLKNLLPANDLARKWVAILFTATIAGLLCLWGIYGIGDYGIYLFIFIPFFMGACPAILYGLKKDISKTTAWLLAMTTLSIFTIGLIVFAIEGLICIIMAAPLALLLAWLGSVVGHGLVKAAPTKAPITLLLIIAGIPTLAFFEKDSQPTVTAVVTSIEIAAPAATVWKNVVAFPQLKAPTEFIFKTGIAYPINAKITGTGVGAFRHCNFTTGSFVEPITVWDEPHLLKFDVLEQPAPMKEISFWDVQAPHLHDYFVSKQGQFKLTTLPNGNTLLEGTTWYYHNIKPAAYWQIWSNHIVHKIHDRVLNHIKEISEQE